MAQEIIFDLNVNTGAGVKTLGQLKDEVKNLKKELDGLEVGSQAFKSLEQKIAGANAQIRETNNNLKGLTTEQLTKSFFSLGQTIAGAFSLATGAVSLFGKESKEVAEAQKKALDAINIVLGAEAVAQSVVNASKFIALGQQKLLNVSLLLEKTAVEGGVVAKYAAAAAQRVLNAVMAANPIGLVVVAVAGLVTALIAFTNSTDKAAESQKKLNEELEKQKAIDERNIKFFNDAATASVKHYERRIELAQAQGQSDAEIVKLQNEKLQYEIKINNGILNSVSNRDTYNKILQETLDKTNQIEANNAKLAVSEAKAQEELTKKQKEESEKRIKQAQDEQKAFEEESKKQSGENFDQDLNNLNEFLTARKSAIVNSSDSIASKDKQLSALTDTELQLRKQLYQDYGKDVSAIDDKILDNKLANDQAELDAEQQKLDAKFNLKQLQATTEVESITLAIQQIKEQRDLDLISYKDDADKKVQITDEANAKIKNSELALLKAKIKAEQDGLQAASQVIGQLSALAKKGSAEQKALTLISIVLDTARGISGAIAAGAGLVFPANLAAIASGIAAVLAGIGQAKAVFSSAPQSTEAKADGGIVKGYSNGGYISQGTTSRADDVPIWVSRGESVINARSTQMFAPILSRLNTLGGGKSFSFADGGLISPADVNLGTSNIEALLAAQVELLQKPTRSYVLETDITSTQNDVSVIEQRAKYS